MDDSHLLTPFIALLRRRPFPLAPTLFPTVVVPMLGVPSTPLIPIVILVMLRRPMAIIPIFVVPRGSMTLVIIVSTVVLPSPAIVVSVPIPFTVAVAISFPFLIAVITTTVTVAIAFSFAVSSVLAILVLVLIFVFIFSVLRGLFAFTTGGGPAVLGGFLLAEAFFLSFDELGEGSPASLFVFERLVLAQVFKE